LAESITAVNIDDMSSVRVEWTNSKLIAQQIEFTLHEIEQGADTRISLSVVVAEVTFVVSPQTCYAPVRKELPVIRETLVHFNLKRFVLVYWIRKTVWCPVNAEVTCIRIWFIANRAKNSSVRVGYFRNVVRNGTTGTNAGRRYCSTNSVCVRNRVDYAIKR